MSAARLHSVGSRSAWRASSIPRWAADSRPPAPSAASAMPPSHDSYSAISWMRGSAVVAAGNASARCWSHSRRRRAYASDGTRRPFPALTGVAVRGSPTRAPPRRSRGRPELLHQRVGHLARADGGGVVAVRLHVVGERPALADDLRDRALERVGGRRLLHVAEHEDARENERPRV